MAGPNVVVFFTDQQRHDTVGCYGCPLDLTGNLDALARRGVRFELAFTCQPVCAPARASMQTGLYATAAGVWRNALALPAGERTLAHYFKEAGYRVGYVGKWHLGGEGIEPVKAELRGGYDYWQAANVLEFTSHPEEGFWYDQADRPVHFTGYRTDALTAKALEFVRTGPEPFFLFLSYLEPHHQNDLKRFVAPAGYAQRYANCPVPPDLRNLPGDWMSQLPDYYGICARLDENLGQILQGLEQAGLAGRTIVLFTSDHGCHFRTRNAEYKRSCHDSSIRIPMVLYGPHLPRGVVVDRPVSLVDAPPTLLEAAGLAVPPRMQGRSLLPLTRPGRSDREEEVFIQISESMVARALRTRRWKYCVYAPDRHGWNDPASDRYVEYQMYDLFSDPAEQVNLAGRGDYAAVAEKLRGRLAARIAQAGEGQVVIEPARYPA